MSSVPEGGPLPPTNDYGSLSTPAAQLRPARPSHHRNASSWISYLEMPSSISNQLGRNPHHTSERSSLLPPNTISHHTPPNSSLLPFSYSMPHVDRDTQLRSTADLNRHLNASDVHHRLSQGRLMGSLRMSDWISTHTPSIPPSPQVRSRSGSWQSSVTPQAADGIERRPYSRRWRKSTVEDEQATEELVKETGNGIRISYQPYCTIDWLHELIKESTRRKKLSQLDGLYGQFKRTWDKSQAWVLVTLVGIFTALVADYIVSTEMWLFELKEGYCATGWRTPKRFCCTSPASYTDPTTHGSISRLLSIFSQSNLLPFISSPILPQLRQSNFNSHGLNSTHPYLYQRPPVFVSGSFISKWAPQLDSPLGTANESCPDWHLWTDLFSPSQNTQLKWIEYVITMGFSLLFAGLASLLTVYLSRSTQIDTANQTQVERENSFSTVNDNQVHRETILHSPHKSSNSQTPTVNTPPKVSYFAAGSGIPEIKCILSGFVIPGYLGLSTMLTKAVGLSLSVGSGLTLGKEGPLVHIACCIGNIFTRLFPKFDRNERKRREVLSAACAAGVSVAFGAPIGGVLFSLEEVSYFFPPRVMWRSCWCAIVAAATLRVLDPFTTGKTVLFEVTYDRQWHLIELGGFVFLGLISGVLGASLAKFNIWWSKNFRKRSWVANHPVLEVLIVAFVTCVFAFSNRFMNLAGTELVFEMFAECKLPNPSDIHSSSTSLACISDPNQTGQLILNLAAAVLLKFFLTGVTFGIKCPAGVFIPSLCIGALMGRILGYLVEYTHYLLPASSIFHFCDANRGFGQSCIIPGVWAMVGAAAMLAGVTRTTLSLAVIVVEITGSLVYILPVSISIIVAKTMADMIEHRSIYDLVMNLNELPYLDAKSEYLHYAKPEEIMDPEAEVIVLKDPLRASDLRQSVDNMKSRAQVGNGFPLLETSASGDRRIWGYIGLVELEHGLTMIEGDPICTFTGADPDVHIQEYASDVESPERNVDLGYLVDHAPVTVSNKQSMEVIHEIFVKLGVRYLVVQNYDGVYLGIIEKNRWLKYLSWNESHHSAGNNTD